MTEKGDDKVSRTGALVCFCENEKKKSRKEYYEVRGK